MTSARILIVEDEALFARSTGKQLHKLGYEVVDTVSSGEAAIERAEALTPDLVLMDINLEGDMDGVAAARHIQERSLTPVIYLTAYADTETIQRAKKTGPFGYLIKPFETRDLHSAIEMALYKHQIEQKLRESEERYRLLIDSMNEGLGVTDENGVFTYVNDKLAEMLGYTREEMVGRHEADFTDQTGRQDLKSQLEQRAKGGHGVYELTLYHKDKHKIPTLVSPKPLFNDEGEFKGSFAVITDISERVKAENALQKSEARLKAIFDTAGIAIALTDTEGRWIQCNQYWEQLMGYPADELSALSNHEITHPDDRPITKECENDLLSGRLDAYRIEKRFIHRRGYIIWADVSVTPIKGQTNEIEALIHAVTDITKRKQAEETVQDSLQKLQIAYKQAQIYGQELAQDINERKQVENKLQQLNEELEQRVTDRTRELSALYDVTAVASESLPLETLLEKLLERVLAAMQSDMGYIHLLDETGTVLELVVQKGVSAELARQAKSISVGEGLVGWIFEHGDPLLIPDLNADPRTAGIPYQKDLVYAGVPMQAGGQVLGVLSVFSRKEHLLNVEEVALLATVADQVAVAVENSRLHRQAERAAVVEERERLARELHDSVTQLLYSVTLFAGAGQRMARAGTLEDPETYLAELGDVAQQALKEMRLLVYELRPPALEQEGLVRALQRRLEAVEQRAGMEAHLVVEDVINLSGELEEGFYRIAQEALNNALKHASATTVTVRLKQKDKTTTLAVIDNGRGFDPHAAIEAGGMGISGIKERAARLGGTLSILSTPDEGSTVQIEVPENHRAANTAIRAKAGETYG